MARPTTRRRFALSMLAVALACGGKPTSEPVAPAAEPVTEPYLSAGTASSADGVSIAYATRGKGRPALLFIHGWSCDRSFWADQVDAFADEFQVVTIDLAGHGDSGTNRDPWTLPAFGDDVKAVVEHLGLSEVVLVGHSMGGPAALEAARLLQDKVEAVIAVDALHNVEFKWPDSYWKPLSDAFTQDFAGTCKSFVTGMFTPEAQTSRAALVADVEQRMCDAPPEIARSLLGLFPPYDMAAALAAVEVPVRSINAPAYPTAIELNRKYSPGYDAVMLEGVGHFLMMEKPVEFNQALRKMIAEITAPAGS